MNRNRSGLAATTRPQMGCGRSWSAQEPKAMRRSGFSSAAWRGAGDSASTARKATTTGRGDGTGMLLGVWSWGRPRQSTEAAHGPPLPRGQSALADQSGPRTPQSGASGRPYPRLLRFAACAAPKEPALPPLLLLRHHLDRLGLGRARGVDRAAGRVNDRGAGDRGGRADAAAAAGHARVVRLAVTDAGEVVAADPAADQTQGGHQRQQPTHGVPSHSYP